MGNFTLKPFLTTNFCSLRYVFIAVLFTFIGYSSYGQTHFESGDSWGTAGWNAYTAMTEMPTGSGKYVIILANSFNADRYYRVSNGAGTNRYGPSGTSDITLAPSNSPYTLEDWNSGNNKAYKTYVNNTAYRYVFKSNGATSKQLLVFEIQGTPITVTAVSNPGATAGTNSTITATLSASLPVGQDVYLRYTNDNFTTSAVVKLAGAGTSYSGTIPNTINTSGATVKYYVFTSGTANVAADGSNADFYTININNNSGSNYSYFVPVAIIAPTLAATTAVDLIGASVARSGGNVTSDGGSAITERGVVYSTVPNPTILDSKVTTAGTTGTYTTNMSGLTPGTLYYVRAYATNAIGTSYGTQTTFTTLAPPTPTAISSGSTSIDLNWTRWTGDRAGASTTYNVMVVRSTDATFTQPTNGVGYAVSSTIGGDVVIYNSNGTSFTDTGLTADTIYYYAFYSEGGTYYSNSATTSAFPSSLSLPTVTTSAVSGLACRDVTFGGTVTSNGSGAITERGFVYSTSANPTISNTKIVVAGTTGSFSSALSGLTSGTTYNVRAYAIDASGIAYGSNISFTTSTSTSSTNFYSDRIYFKNGTNASEKYYLEDNSIPMSCVAETAGSGTWNGRYLGSTSPGATLQLGGYLITKGVQNGTNPIMNYRVYLTSAGPGAMPFTKVTMNWLSDCNADGVIVNTNNNDKVWNKPLFNMTVPSLPGNYTIEVYYERGGGDLLQVGGTVYLSNCNVNYKANIDIRAQDIFSDVIYYDNGIAPANYTAGGYDSCSAALTVQSGSWDGKYLGNYTTGQVLKIGGMVLSIDGVSPASPVSATDTYLNYRIYKNGDSIPSFTTMNLAEVGGTICGDSNVSKFEQASLATLWTTTSVGGSYTIELYYTAKLNDGTVITRNNSGNNYKATFTIVVGSTPAGERDPNDGNYTPNNANASGIFESYMGVLVKDSGGTPISGLNRVFNMDGAIGSTNSTSFDFGIQDPGLSFNVGTEVKVFTKGTHKVCGCSSWNYVYNSTTVSNPVESDFPLPAPGSLFTATTNGKFVLLNSSVYINGNQPFNVSYFPAPLVNASGSTSSGTYNGSLGTNITKFKDYTDASSIVTSINNPVQGVLCPTCSGPYKVAIAMLAWVSTTNNCNDPSSFIYHRDINKNKVSDDLVVLNPAHNDAPSSVTGSAFKNSLPGTSLFYVSRVTIGASDGLKRWTGTKWQKFVNPVWVDSTPPTFKNDVLMDTDYSTTGGGGNIQCNDLTVNTGVVATIEEGGYIEALNTVTTLGTGKIIVRNTGNLVQRCDEKPSTAYIEHKKTTGLKRKWDYVYWGTPIVQNMFSSKPFPYDIGYRRQSGPGGGWKPLNASSTVGEGFILRVGNSAPWNDGSPGYPTEWQINGTANNGIFSIPVIQENYATNPTNYNNGALLANPYPCAVDGKKFLEDPSNLNLEGSLFFWTSATRYPGTGAYQDPDYAVWNLTGSTITANGQTPSDGTIPSGQGFFVRVMTNGTAVFKDYMRSTNRNTMFFRKSAVDRYWINLTDGVSQSSQILIGHLEGATNDMDRMYDARKMGETTIELYSLNKKDRLTINGRAPFDSSDEISLGVKKSVNGPQVLTLTLTKKEGIFESGTPIYLYDKKQKYYHNLQSGSYTFTMSPHEENNRFTIIYEQNTNKMLGTNDFDNASATAYIKDQKLNIAANEGLKKVTIYDVSGRVVVGYNTVKFEKTFTSDFNYSKGVYIAKIVLENGKVVSQKIMN